MADQAAPLPHPRYAVRRGWRSPMFWWMLPFLLVMGFILAALTDWFWLVPLPTILAGRWGVRIRRAGGQVELAHLMPWEAEAARLPRWRSRQLPLDGLQAFAQAHRRGEPRRPSWLGARHYGFGHREGTVLVSGAQHFFIGIAQAAGCVQAWQREAPATLDGPRRFYERRRLWRHPLPWLFVGLVAFMYVVASASGAQFTVNGEPYDGPLWKVFVPGALLLAAWVHTSGTTVSVQGDVLRVRSGWWFAAELDLREIVSMQVRDISGWEGAAPVLLRIEGVIPLVPRHVVAYGGKAVEVRTGTHAWVIGAKDPFALVQALQPQVAPVAAPRPPLPVSGPEP